MNVHPETGNRFAAGKIVPIAVVVPLLLTILVPGLLNISAADWTRHDTTRYATVYSSTDEDLLAFTREIGSGIKYLLERPKKDGLLTRKRVDALTEEVMKILGMRPVNLRFSIRVYATKIELDRAYVLLMNDPQPPAAWYNDSTKTIAISPDTVTSGILAHEIAHAVICAYFNAPPPSQTQEILAQYVDRHLGE